MRSKVQCLHSPALRLELTTLSCATEHCATKILRRPAFQGLTIVYPKVLLEETPCGKPPEDEYMAALVSNEHVLYAVLSKLTSSMYCGDLKQSRKMNGMMRFVVRCYGTESTGKDKIDSQFRKFDREVE
jgi:hypothetical protein